MRSHELAELLGALSQLLHCQDSLAKPHGARLKDPNFPGHAKKLRSGAQAVLGREAHPFVEGGAKAKTVDVDAFSNSAR